jgi:hypothetical protein
MNGDTLQDKISFGMGRAARKLGAPFIVYRPGTSIQAPLSSRNRVIKLYASFNAKDETYRRVSSHGQAEWWGVFDTSYTQPGDYLVGPSGIFFVSAQRPILPAQCVRTNRVLSIVRPGAPVTGGYAGLVNAGTTPLLSLWPASVLTTASRSASKPTETRFGEWSVLLPILPLNLEINDVVTDDLGAAHVISSAEQTDLGWRLAVRQVAA